MKESKRYFILLLILVTTCVSYSQNTPLKELHQGNYLPRVTLKGFIDDTSKRVAIQELYQHKLLLLDFWATWCSPCIKGLSELAAIKRHFGNKIEIVAVGYESYQKISDFFKKYPDLRSKDVRIMVNDSLLSMKLFKHKSLPHLAWIDSTGKVIATTEEGYMTVENIQKLINGMPIAIRQKIDDLNFKPDKPFHLKDSSFLYRSLLSGYANGILSYESTLGSIHGDATKHSRKFLSNGSIRDLYWSAVFHHTINYYNSERMVFEVKDSLKYFEPTLAPYTFKHSRYATETDWAVDNTYCYDLVFPKPIPDSILYQYMLQDLNRYFNLNGRYESRLTACYILNFHKNNKALFDSVTDRGKTEYKTGKPVKITHQKISKLLDVLNQQILNGMIIDETGIDDLINIDLSDLYSGKPADMATLNTFLTPYGLYLVKAYRKVPVFVVSER